MCVCPCALVCVGVGQGTLLCGTLRKSTLGRDMFGLIHVLMNDLGPAATSSFMDQLQRVVNAWLAHHGFSVGVGDALIPPDAQARVSDVIDKAKASVLRLVQQSRQGTAVRQAGQASYDCFERMANAILNAARDEVRVVRVSRVAQVASQPFPPHHLRAAHTA